MTTSSARDLPDRQLNENKIHTYARSLFTHMGPKAEVVAAQKITHYEAIEDAVKLIEWRRIRSALIMMNGRKLH